MCVCVFLRNNIVIAYVCKSSKNWNACSLFVLSLCHGYFLCSPFAIWTLPFILSKCFWSVKFPAIHWRWKLERERENNQFCINFSTETQQLGTQNMPQACSFCLFFFGSLYRRLVHYWFIILIFCLSSCSLSVKSCYQTVMPLFKL